MQLNHLDAKKSSAPHFMAQQLAEAAPQTYAEYSAFTAMDSKVRASVLATARAALDLWSDPAVCRFTAGNSVDIEGLRREHTALFLIVPGPANSSACRGLRKRGTSRLRSQRR